VNDGISNLIRNAYTPYIRQTMVWAMQGAGASKEDIDKVRAGWAEWDALPEEEKQRREKQRAEEAEASRAALHEANVDRWENVRGAAYIQNPTLWEVAKMHEPTRQYRDYDECQACKAEVSGYEYDMEEWPCATFITIEKGLGLE